MTAINDHTAAHLREQIMALVGRAAPDPAEFRRALERLTLPELSALLEFYLQE